MRHRPEPTLPAQPPARERTSDLAALDPLQQEIERRIALEDELHEVLSTTVAELEASNARLRRFASTVAHDLRSPLVTIVGFSELLEERRDLPPDVIAYVGKIRAAGAACAEMIEWMLGAAETADALVLGPVDLATELTWVGVLLGDDGVDLAPTGPLPVVHGSQLALRQVLLNLVANAAKHRGAHETVRVRVSASRAAGGGWEVVVTDDGPGIPASRREAAFTPGQRLESTTRGNGMGLASCRSIVEAQGGRIWLDAAPGGGLAVHLWLPDAPSS